MTRERNRIDWGFIFEVFFWSAGVVAAVVAIAWAVVLANVTTVF